SVVRNVQGLSPNTTYHYRVVAVSELAGEAESFPGPDRMFTTQRVGAELVLPDGRQWELVSPADKRGALISPIEEVALVQASASGEAITYGGSRPTEAAAQGYSEREQILSTRGVAGWISKDISLPHTNASGSAVGVPNEYPFFSEDLSLGLADPDGEFTSLSPDASPPDTERTQYVRHNSTCASAPASCYTPLVTGAEGFADVPEGVKFGGIPTHTQGEAGFVDATPDLSHAIVSSAVALTAPPNPKEKTANGLYEWSAASPPSEALKLVSILPDGKLAGGLAELGREDTATRRAVSDDGSRIVWDEFLGHLYLRDMNDKSTVELDAVQSGSGAGQVTPEFQLASSDGSRVFFTDEQRLTADSGEASGQRDLYECAIVQVAGEPRCELSDLTSVQGVRADVQGSMPGASEDGSWVYFVANGVLADGALPGDCLENRPPPGATCNLYVRHYNGGSWEAPKLVAVLSGDDWPDWRGEQAQSLRSLTARVSPDGRKLVFMSDRSLTGYDNRDAQASGRPDEEVYMYDAEASGGAGRVVCVSCDPTGARPAGVQFAKLRSGLVGLESNGLWREEQGMAANVPSWTPSGLTMAFHQSRYLSDEGRVFFDSSDALVAQDINHDEDVYEYEPVGIGDCTDSSATFSEVDAGCVGLVSSGTAIGESGFVDASESGDDVFFLTGERLVGQDVDTALDLYDAHVCTLGAPCLSAPVLAPACTTADACRTAPAPQPGIFGAPASATFTGTGNRTVSASPAVLRPRSLTRAQKLARALSACRKDRRKRKRTVCERTARKRYAAKPARNDKAAEKGRR
ncbi:MAG TPA: hypothetical protein VK781_13275, partial [Solirubrobacteraceae bacterium]|nr:hypothetical protein [Solirubrobacteraceae bacterium]